MTTNLFLALQIFMAASIRSSMEENHVSPENHLEGLDPIELSGHFPAIEIYKVPDDRVRVEGVNVWPGDSLSGGKGGEPDQEAALVYAVNSRPIGVELTQPQFFLPRDERILQVWHQGELLHECETPAAEICKYSFDYSNDVGKRFTVRALSKHSKTVIQEERIYTPYPYMCAASLFSRPDIKTMDCSQIESFPETMYFDFSKTSTRGFAIELEFLAKDGSLTNAVGGAEPLEKVKKCAMQKVKGTGFPLETWNWEQEPSMVPFGPRDGVPESEYVGLMAELTSPGPPNVLFGQSGMRDVAAVFHTVTEMGTQVGLWAQLHVHVNVIKQSANPKADCCLNADEVIHIWTAWSKYQMVIDEMQNPTNVNNKWAKPLYMEDPLMMQVFSNMHKNHGSKNNGQPVDIKQACQLFYGEGQCDTKDHAGWKPPHAEEESAVGYYHHGPARYSAVNLAPLSDKGTMEIRQQAGTLDIRRAQRWIQFVLAFVETFKTGVGLHDFFDGTLEQDVKELKTAQTMASFEQLFAAIGERMDQQSKDYFINRGWKQGRCVFEDER